MIYLKYLRKSLEHRIRTIWIWIFTWLSFSLIIAVAARCYVLEARNVDIVFSILRRFGLPIRAQGTVFQWKWQQAPQFGVDRLYWENSGKTFSLTKAHLQLRFSVRNPLQRFSCQELQYAYTTDQTQINVDYLAMLESFFAMFKTAAFMEECRVQRLCVRKDNREVVLLQDIAWDTHATQKLVGRMNSDQGVLSWSYCPKSQFFSARLEQGVQRALNALGYVCTSASPIMFGVHFKPQVTHMTIESDQHVCRIGKTQHTLHKTSFQIACKDGVMSGRGVVGMDGLTINLEGSHHKTWQLSWKSQGALAMRDLKIWWNTRWAPDAQSWVEAHFDSKYGHVDRMYGKISGTGTKIDVLHGSFQLVNTLLRPISGIPEIEKLCAHANFDLKKFHFSIQNGLLSKQKLCSGSVHISDLSDNPRLILGVRLEGSVTDVLRILGCKRLNVEKDIPVLRPKGQAYTFLRMRFPLISDLRLSQIILDYESGLDHTAFDLSLLSKVMAYKNGKIYIKGSQHDIAIEGTGKLDQYPATWSWIGTFGKRAKHKLNANVWINPALWMPSWCKQWVSSKFVPLKLNYTPEKQRLDAILDLTTSVIHVPWINWKKSASLPLLLRCTFLDTTKEAQLTVTGAAEGGGHVNLGTTFRAEGKIHIPKHCNVFVKLTPEERQIDISGRYLNLQLIRDTFIEKKDVKKHAKTLLPAMDLRLTCNLKTVQWDKTHFLKRLRGTVRCKQRHVSADSTFLESYHWRDADIHATIHHKKATSVLHIFAKPQGKDTRIQCIVKELSALSSLCGLTPVLRSGQSGEWIGVQKQDGTYQGQLTLHEVITKGLWAVKLLSLLSPTAVTELLHSSLDFTEIFVRTLYKNHTLFLTKGVAKGLNLGGFLSGKIDTQQGTLLLNGGLVPAYVLNTVFSGIPIIGDLLGHEKGIISSQFTITGTFEEPHFLVNPLSVFGVGGLKALFE